MKKIYPLVIAFQFVFGWLVGHPLVVHSTHKKELNGLHAVSKSNENNSALANSSCATFSLPFIETFDTSVPPTCWTQYPGSNGVGTTQQWEFNATTHSGPGAAYIGWENVTNGSLAEDWLVTPAIDLTGSENNAMTFWAKDGFTEEQGSLYSVKVSTTSQTDRSSFVDLITYTEEQLGHSYNLKTVNLDAYSGSIIYIAFVMTNDDGDAWFLDDVSVYDSTVCTPPSQATAFNASSIDGGSGTATLNWTRTSGDNVLVVMKSGSAVDSDPSTGTIYSSSTVFGSGDELGTGNFVVYNGSASSISISNLNPDTTYHVALFEYGSSGTCYNTEELTGSFYVPCDPFNLPFNEGFENASFPPTCWTSYRGENGTGMIQDWQTTTNAHSGSQAAFVDYENDPNGTTEDWLVTPSIRIDAGADASLIFFTKDGDASSDYGSIYTVRVSTTSQTDRASFTTISTFSETTLGSTYNQKTIDLSAYNNSTIYIAFVLTQNFGDNWFLDDINITGNSASIDSDTEVYAAAVPVAAQTIIAADTMSPETSADAFAFTIQDSGTSDGLSTNVTTMRFVPGTDNTADWTATIQGLTLTDGNAVAYTPSTITIQDDEIILNFNPAIVIPNGTSLDFTLGFYLRPTGIVNGSRVQFEIDGTSSGFDAVATGSGFASTFSGGTITANNITIDSSTLALSSSDFDKLSIYSSASSRAVIIKGEISSKTVVSIYDLQGRVVMTNNLENGTSVNQITISNLNDGIYVVKLSSNAQQLTRKIIIR